MPLSSHRESPFPDGFGQRLRAFMAEHELSAAQLAERAGLTPPVIYAWLDEKGKRPPRRENVTAVAKALGRSYDELWGVALDTSAQTRLVELESFVQEVRRLLDHVEPQPITRPLGERLLVERTQEAIDKRTGKTVKGRARRDGTKE